MKFVERRHYCSECKKDVSFPQFITTKKFITSEHSCRMCKNTVISYWWDIPRKQIYSMLIALPFFVFCVLYSFWRHYQQILEPVDIFIAIANVFFGGFILVYTSMVKKKPEPPEKSDFSTEKLKNFRIQSIYVIILNAIGFGLASGFNAIIWIIWTTASK